jgi:hypothetical protein
MHRPARQRDRACGQPLIGAPVQHGEVHGHRVPRQLLVVAQGDGDIKFGLERAAVLNTLIMSGRYAINATPWAGSAGQNGWRPWLPTWPLSRPMRMVTPGTEPAAAAADRPHGQPARAPHPHSPNGSRQPTTGHRNNPEPSASSTAAPSRPTVITAALLCTRPTRPPEPPVASAHNGAIVLSHRGSTRGTQRYLDGWRPGSC